MILKPSGRVARLDINFAESASLAAWVRWLILAAGIAALVSQAQSYALTRDRLAAIESRAARLSLPKGMLPARDSKSFNDQIAAVERVVTRLTFDWQVLFAELERATTDDVALSSIEPEPESRSLSVSGMARDYPALLAYLGKLRNSKVLSNVFLKRHEVARNQPLQGISFTLTANWPQHESTSGKAESADARASREN